MRLLAAVTAAIAVLSMQAGAAAKVDPGGGANVYQVAEADWLDLKAKTFYFAMGVRMVGAPSGATNVGFVGRGKCEVQRSQRITMISCFGRGYGGDVPIDAFQMDPALGTAHLEMSARGFDHVVDWTGEDLPISGAQASGGGTNFDASAGVGRWAPAAATLFGKELQGDGRHSFGILAEGASAYLWAGGRRIWFGRDGLPRIQATYRIPR